MSEVPLYVRPIPSSLGSPERRCMSVFASTEVPPHKKQPPPRTLQQAYAWGHVVALGWGGVSYERGTPVWVNRKRVNARTVIADVFSLH